MIAHGMRDERSYRRVAALPSPASGASPGMSGIAGHLPLSWAYGSRHGSGWSMLETRAAAPLEWYSIDSDRCGLVNRRQNVADEHSPTDPTSFLQKCSWTQPNSTVGAIIPLSYQVTFVMLLPRATNAHCTYSLGVAPWLAGKVSLLRANKLQPGNLCGSGFSVPNCSDSYLPRSSDAASSTLMQLVHVQLTRRLCAISSVSTSGTIANNRKKWTTNFTWPGRASYCASLSTRRCHILIPWQRRFVTSDATELY
jgi:hypothetical protein